MRLFFVKLDCVHRHKTITCASADHVLEGVRRDWVCTACSQPCVTQVILWKCGGLYFVEEYCMLLFFFALDIVFCPFFFDINMLVHFNRPLVLPRNCWCGGKKPAILCSGSGWHSSGTLLWRTTIYTQACPCSQMPSLTTDIWLTHLSQWQGSTGRGQPSYIHTCMYCKYAHTHTHHKTWCTHTHITPPTPQPPTVSTHLMVMDQT